MARQGGIGIIHKNMSIEAQAEEVDKVKRSENGVITDPFYLSPEHTLEDANNLMAKFRISGVPITEGKKLEMCIRDSSHCAGGAPEGVPHLYPSQRKRGGGKTGGGDLHSGSGDAGGSRKLSAGRMQDPSGEETKTAFFPGPAGGPGLPGCPCLLYTSKATS